MMTIKDLKLEKKPNELEPKQVEENEFLVKILQKQSELDVLRPSNFEYDKLRVRSEKSVEDSHA